MAKLKNNTMENNDKIRILISMMLIACGISMLITGTSNEKTASIFVFLFAFYPISKIGFED